MPITDQAQADVRVNNAHKQTPRNAKTRRRIKIQKNNNKTAEKSIAVLVVPSVNTRGFEQNDCRYTGPYKQY